MAVCMIVNNHHSVTAHHLKQVDFMICRLHVTKTKHRLGEGANECSVGGAPQVVQAFHCTALDDAGDTVVTESAQVLPSGASPSSGGDRLVPG